TYTGYLPTDDGTEIYGRFGYLPGAGLLSAAPSFGSAALDPVAIPASATATARAGSPDAVALPPQKVARLDRLFAAGDTANQPVAAPRRKLATPEKIDDWSLDALGLF